MTVRLGLRSRIVLVGIIVAIVAYNADATVSFVGRHLPVSCSSRLLRGGPLCGAEPVVSGLALLRIAVAGLALIALTLLAIWAMWPLRELADVVSRVGPQNLGYRIQATGRQDERRRLSDRLDEMMDRLAAAYEAQRQFAANASHELRTPLAVQRTLIEVSMAAPLTSEQIELVTRQLLQTNERNEQLIEGLLVLSESDRGLVSRTRLRLDLIAGRVIEQHRQLAATAGIRIDSSLLERTVSGEEVLLERLVTNLVRNAIIYNHPGGYLRVEVAHHPALVVTNSGDRVPGEAVDGLFEPFRRLGGDRIHRDGGAGLGLTIVRSIAAAHDANVAATPGVDGGLRLSVDLPDPGRAVDRAATSGGRSPR